MEIDNNNTFDNNGHDNDFMANVSKSLLIDVIKRYEQWEAYLIMEDSCWQGSMPKLTNELYEELLEIQKLRNKALSIVSNV